MPTRLKKTSRGADGSQTLPDQFPDAKTDSALPSADQDAFALRGTDVVKTFQRAGGDVVRAVNHVSLSVQRGEFVVLLGPSGCGKTSLLRCVAGLENPTGGRIEIGGKVMFDSETGIRVPTERRNISMMFQSYALWPHMSLFENIAYPLKARSVSKDEIHERVSRMLDIVGIPKLASQYAGEISGGQQQRVALARALVAQDGLVLFDEPLSNVDAKTRAQLRLELLSLQKEFGFAAVYVTHDQVEAMELGDRIVVMSGGSAAQVGTPSEIYERPSSRYVANFVGTANEIPGRVTAIRAGEASIESGVGTLSAVIRDVELAAGDEAVALFRPERASLTEDRPFPDVNSWEGTIERALYLGSHCEHVVRVGEMSHRVSSETAPLFEQGARVWLSVQPRDLLAVPFEHLPEA